MGAFSKATFCHVRNRESAHDQVLAQRGLHLSLTFDLYVSYTGETHFLQYYRTWQDDYTNVLLFRFLLQLINYRYSLVDLKSLLF